MDVFGTLLKAEPPPKQFYPPEKHESRIVRCCKGCVKSSIQGIITGFISIRAFSLVMIALLGPFLFYASYNILFMPAVDTLKARLRLTSCIVAKAIEVKGKSKCKWSSCRMGCTDQELYTCWNIYVLVDDYWRDYENSTIFIEDESKHYVSSNLHSSYQNTSRISINLTNEAFLDNLFPNPEKDNITDILDSNNHNLDPIEYHDKNVDEISEQLMQPENMTKLYVSVKGCIYDSCIDWWNMYGHVGFQFPCFVSRSSTIAIPHVDYWEVSLQIFFGIVPLLLGIMAVFFIYFIYCRQGATDNSLRLTPDPEKVKQKWETAKAQIIQDIMDKHNKKGKKKIDPKRIIEIMKSIKIDKKNKISPEAFATAVLAVIDAGEGMFGGDTAFTGFKGFDNIKDENPKNKGAKWRRIAAQAKKFHPTVAPAHRFTEVDFNYENKI